MTKSATGSSRNRNFTVQVANHQLMESETPCIPAAPAAPDAQVQAVGEFNVTFACGNGNRGVGSITVAYRGVRLPIQTSKWR